MKLLIALAFIALASAAPEDFAPSAVKVVDGPIASEDVSPIKVVDSPVAEQVSPIKVAHSPAESVADVDELAEKVVYAAAAEKISPIKVAYSPAESVADEASPVNVVDAALEVPQVQVPKVSPEILYQDVRNLIDISPAFVSNDVMEQVDNVKVVDGPVRGIVPREMWRGPAPMMEEQKIDAKVPVGVPREMWRGPAPIELPKGPAPRPTYWRDLPQRDFRPVYHHDNILR